MLNIATPKFDNQISLGARLLFIRAQEIMLSEVVKSMDSGKSSTEPPGKKSALQPSSACGKLLKACREVINQANEGNFYRITIAATITFVKVAQLDAWYRRAHDRMETHVENEETSELEDSRGNFEIARDLLTAALELCDRLANCSELQNQVQAMLRLYEGPRYEVVTFEELQQIKSAMVSGRGGIATHSGHWYNCTNGHQVGASSS